MRIVVLLVAATGVAQLGTSRAQEAGTTPPCASIQSDSERLACYDRAARGTTQQPAPAAAAPAPTAPPASPAAPAVVAAAPAPAEPHPQSSGSAAPPASAPAATASSRQAAPQAPAVPGVTQSTHQPAAVVPIVVLSTRALPGRGVEFTTDRGDVWVQADAKPLRLPPTPFNAQIKPGSLGSVFLVVPDARLGVRVQHRD
jgi:hypothetical protein